jgi:hypothetical protein
MTVAPVDRELYPGFDSGLLSKSIMGTLTAVCDETELHRFDLLKKMFREPSTVAIHYNGLVQNNTIYLITLLSGKL